MAANKGISDQYLQRELVPGDDDMCGQVAQRQDYIQGRGCIQEKCAFCVSGGQKKGWVCCQLFNIPVLYLMPPVVYTARLKQKGCGVERL